MTRNNDIGLYELATGESVEGWDKSELREVGESVQRVRKATSEAESISAIGWLIPGGEDEVRRVIDEIRAGQG